VRGAEHRAAKVDRRERELEVVGTPSGMLKRHPGRRFTGTAATVAAVLILAWTALRLDLQEHTWRELLPTILVRLSLVLFIEVFGFFFLRMYRDNLAEYRNFHTELSNVDLRALALRATVLRDDPETMKSVITGLIATERNFVLKPGESTIDLERA